MNIKIMSEFSRVDSNRCKVCAGASKAPNFVFEVATVDFMNRGEKTKI